MSAIQDVISIAGKLRELSQKIKDADTRNLIADLNMALADLKMETVDLKEQCADLKRQISRLEERADLREVIQVRDDVYFFDPVPPGYGVGPYCPNCLNSRDHFFMVQHVPLSDMGKYFCVQCKTSYGKPGSRPPQQETTFGRIDV